MDSNTDSKWIHVLEVPYFSRMLNVRYEELLKEPINFFDLHFNFGKHFWCLGRNSPSEPIIMVSNSIG